MSKVSIIVPVYNSEKYLKEAIYSLINQTMKDIEIILIDDGSTDNSSIICDDFAKKDRRVIVKHIKNNGLCNARNQGIKLAKSKYVMFMDNDDRFDYSACEDNYRLMQKLNLDMIKFGRKEIITDNERVIKEDIRIFNEEIFEENRLKKEKMNLFYNGVFDCVWDGMFKRDILVEFDTSLKMGGEDYLFGLTIYTKLKKIMTRNKVYYYHYVRNGISTSTKYNEDLIATEIKIFNKYKKILGSDKTIDFNKYNIMIARNYISAIAINYANKKCNLSIKEKIEGLKKVHFEFNNKSKILKMFMLSYKFTIVMLLYKYKLYSLLLFLYKTKYDINYRKKETKV